MAQKYCFGFIILVEFSVLTIHESPFTVTDMTYHHIDTLHYSLCSVMNAYCFLVYTRIIHNSNSYNAMNESVGVIKNNKFRRLYKWLWPILQYYTRSYLEGLRKTMNNLGLDGQPLHWGSNLGTFKYLKAWWLPEPRFRLRYRRFLRSAVLNSFLQS
jgi:hypothetical protein